MVATAVPLTTITRTGAARTTPPAADVTNGNSVANDGATWLEVDNADTATHPLTVHFGRSIDGQVVTPRTYTIPASAVAYKVGPFSAGDYGQVMSVTADSVQLKIAAYRLAKS